MAKCFTLIKGGVTAPAGFLANAVYCGIKKKSRSALDLALLYSEKTAVAAGLFTSNKVKAASVRLSIKNLRFKQARAVIVNGGNANCCNGRQGEAGALTMVTGTAERLHLKPREVLVASTGVIGRRLPVHKIIRKLPELAAGLSRSKGNLAARGIMTTDTVPKESALRLRIGGRTVTIGGMAKGVGMISPNLATMLCFISTDAVIEHTALKKALKDAVEGSFNCISVDGDMSTNDTVIIMANGEAGNKTISSGSPDLRKFSMALSFLTMNLARKILSDGEGATRTVEIEVKGAVNQKDAYSVARQIENSPLVKTMITGADPNWGRVAGACGAADADVRESRLDISICGYNVFRRGSPIQINYNKLHRLLTGKEICISVNLNLGRAEAKRWTCDLSKEYVRINSEYST